MRKFMSNDKEVQAPKAAVGIQPAAECGSCGGSTGVREAGQEDITPGVTAGEDNGETGEKETVVMSGPLGAAVTEALNKALKKKQVATESLNSHVQANGQIYNANEFISRTSRSVGAVPLTGDSPTVVNTLLDAASKVDQVDFVFVHSSEPAVSEAIMPQKAILADPTEALEGYAVESVEVVVRVCKVRHK